MLCLNGDIYTSWAILTVTDSSFYFWADVRTVAYQTSSSSNLSASTTGSTTWSP